MSNTTCLESSGSTLEDGRNKYESEMPKKNIWKLGKPEIHTTPEQQKQDTDTIEK